MTVPREGERGEGREGGRQDETVATPAAYLHEVGSRESLAHSVDYVDPQVGPFPMAEREPIISPSPTTVVAMPLSCLRAILEYQLTHWRLRVQTRILTRLKHRYIWKC